MRKQTMMPRPTPRQHAHLPMKHCRIGSVLLPEGTYGDGSHRYLFGHAVGRGWVGRG
jgi:hypothetical protein